MRPAGWILPLVAALTAGVSALGQQPPSAPDITAQVRAAMASGGLIEGQKVLDSYRATHGATPETIDALLWLARGALSGKLFSRASQYATESRDLAVASLPTSGDRAGELQRSIAASLEVLALAMTAEGGRSDAVRLLQSGLDEYRDPRAAEEIRNTLRLLSLEGQPAPRLDGGITLGPRLNTSKAPAQATLLFFWAHWCAECKSEAPMLERLATKYAGRGLSIVAPTRRYGYADAGRPASPDKELRYIVRIRDTFYKFLKREPVPVTDANYKAYGVSLVPMHVLTDRDGIVRLYRPGRMSEAELEAAIVGLIER